MAEPHPMETRYLHRTLLVAMGFSLFFGLIVARLWFLQVYAHEEFVKRAQGQQLQEVSVQPRRATIYASNGDPLAISVSRKSVYMEPEYLEESEDDPTFPANLARDLVHCVYGDELDEAELQARIETFTTRMRLQNDLKLRGTDETETTGTETQLKGVVNGRGQAFLKGKIQGREATLSGEIKPFKPISLQGKIEGETEILFSGEPMANRSMLLTGQVEGRTVELKGYLAWRPRFLVGRHLNEEKAEQLGLLIKKYELSRRALCLQEEWDRNYPNGSLASHVIGLTRADDHGDNIGASGVERQYSPDLEGHFSTYTVQVAFQQSLGPLDEAAFTSATGNHVYLTLNKAIQQYAEEALAWRVNDPEIRANAGICVVQEVETGAILAMASYPSFDPNSPSQVVPRNRCITDAIQPGSVMKIFTSMALLENGKMSPFEMVDCDNRVHVFEVGRSRYRVVDSHSVGLVTVMRAFAESSNIGFVKLGLRLEKEEFYRQLQRLRFGERTGIDLPGESAGRLYPLDAWSGFSRISVSFGYELMLTPVQVISAVSAIANGGQYMRPHVLKEIRSPQNELIRRYEPENLGKVCEPETAKILLSMMEQVVVMETGSGKIAAVPGYRVGGKTGTTRKDDKPSEDSPENRYYSSFAGIIPLDRPKIAIYCWIDEPKGKTIYGGKVAAPVFQRVAEHAMRVLAIPPDPVLLAEAAARKEKEKKRLGIAPEKKARKNPPVETSETLLAEGGYLPQPMPVPEGTMPDLTGLTLAEAVEQIQALGLDMELQGTGVVTQQEPLPGTPLTPGLRGQIFFERPSTLMGKMRNSP